MDRRRTELAAGMAAGVVGLLVFLVLHQLWVRPIWFILPFGLVVAAVGGAVTGWAYGLLLPHLPGRPFRSLAIVALIAAILLPSVVLAELRKPLFDISAPSARLQVSTLRASLLFVLELLVTSAVVGGLAGWFIGRSRRAALATAAAGFVFALGPGHNIPFIGSTPGVMKQLVIIAAVVVASAVTLVGVQARLQRRE